MNGQDLSVKAAKRCLVEDIYLWREWAEGYPPAWVAGRSYEWVIIVQLPLLWLVVCQKRKYKRSLARGPYERFTALFSKVLAHETVHILCLSEGIPTRIHHWATKRMGLLGDAPRLLSDNPPCNFDLIQKEVDDLSTPVSRSRSSTPRVSGIVSRRRRETRTGVRNRPLCAKEGMI